MQRAFSHFPLMLIGQPVTETLLLMTFVFLWGYLNYSKVYVQYMDIYSISYQSQTYEAAIQKETAVIPQDIDTTERVTTAFRNCLQKYL